jgi:hypothetical protein
VISIDGPGDVNASTRGINGDAVLDRISKLIDTGLAGPSTNTEIVINTVVTENNINTLPAFAARINAVSPSITLALLPLMPIESEMSALKEREAGYKRFTDVYARIKSAHEKVIHNVDCVMRHKNLRKIQCYNQYFTIRFSPHGEFFTCGADITSQLRRIDHAYKKVLRKGGLRKLFTMVMKSLLGSMGKIDFTCRNICNCESWLDMTLLGKDTEYAPVLLRGFRKRLTDDDYMELDAFVKKYINADFDVVWFKRIVEGQ